MDDVTLANFGLPGVGHSIAASAPREIDKHAGWRASGIRILCPSNRIGIIHHNPSRDVLSDRFTSWSQEEFHYCPRGTWSDWVGLARRILAVEQVLEAEESEIARALGPRVP